MLGLASAEWYGRYQAAADTAAASASLYAYALESVLRLVEERQQHYAQSVATCDLCGATPPDAEIGDHLLREHPEVGDFECWPDGGPVIVDESVETPADLD